MDRLFPFLIGFTGKIYDDITDLKLAVNPLYLEALKSINLLFYTLSSINDFMFSLSTFILSIFGAGIDNLFWKSFIYVTLVLTIISFSSFTSTNWRFFCVILVLLVLVIYIEETQFPEEYSYKKLFSRLFGLGLLATIYFTPSSLYIEKIFGTGYYLETGNVDYIFKLVLVFIGGLSMSIISQSYLLLTNLDS
jgi:hypothetical protein